MENLFFKGLSIRKILAKGLGCILQQNNKVKRKRKKNKSFPQVSLTMNNVMALNWSNSDGVLLLFSTVSFIVRVNTTIYRIPLSMYWPRVKDYQALCFHRFIKLNNTLYINAVTWCRMFAWHIKLKLSV